MNVTNYTFLVCKTAAGLVAAVSQHGCRSLRLPWIDPRMSRNAAEQLYLQGWTLESIGEVLDTQHDGAGNVEYEWRAANLRARDGFTGKLHPVFTTVENVVRHNDLHEFVLLES